MTFELRWLSVYGYKGDIDVEYFVYFNCLIADIFKMS